MSRCIRIFQLTFNAQCSTGYQKGTCENTNMKKLTDSRMEKVQIDKLAGVEAALPQRQQEGRIGSGNRESLHVRNDGRPVHAAPICC